MISSRAGVIINACIMAYDGHQNSFPNLKASTCPKPSCGTRACRITYINKVEDMWPVIKGSHLIWHTQ